MPLFMIPLFTALALLSISLYIQSTLILHMLKKFDQPDEIRTPKIIKLSATAAVLALLAMTLLFFVIPVTLFFPG